MADSWGARGMKESCTPASKDVETTARLDDALGAPRFLQSDPTVDPRRVGAIGWSNGGDSPSA
ncbi:MAG: hypothetical protein HY294_15475 [Candidatus Rokubacteria bacterium]|nr:hypothetical protein [Candidatus Rokubacteria bacterium]